MNNTYEKEIRYRLLKLLSHDPHLTQREMSQKMGISLGKINYCLSQLAEKGMVKIGRFKGSKNKIGYIYNLTPGGLEEKARLTLSFLRHKKQEYEEIKKQIEELTKEAEQGGLSIF
ncbi:EPS-associated transcriptional regulator, MarR family [Desulfonema limicola]|uniref:EPS-associated transcriptional regulator, MarR family n=1 Tax=Desulfonema limicola TaxID=45656 RepID=A0A975BDE2_9BACT|nr:MarR family EPS-associated transcriptional regulator [Desulfonema limicola]QTA83124.1 EPS-associated transcriptional regulator, MarR family [Desulfonema limicola]